MKKFKLVTLLGIRPDLIRMYKLIGLLDRGQKEHYYEHIFVHSGQHFDFELDKVFYKELNIRKPDINLKMGKILKKRGKTSHAYQSAFLFEKVNELTKSFKPNAVLFLGDNNTVTVALVVAKNNIPVIHIEGGWRSFDWRMPEDKNRIVVDHLSDIIYVYLKRCKDSLLREGIPPFRIKVVGNIIVDALKHFLPLAAKRKILETFGVKKGEYALCTLHREENIEDKSIFTSKIRDLIRLAKEIPVILPVMPRVKRKLQEYQLSSALSRSKVVQTKPLGFLDFLKLESNARLIITDSGSVQEEALILGVPCLVSRRSTERPETIWAGAATLSDENLYQNALKTMKLKTDWDRTVLNPVGGSPSERIWKDLVYKIKNGFFDKSRKFDFIKSNKFVKEAYNKFK